MPLPVMVAAVVVACYRHGDTRWLPQKTSDVRLDPAALALTFLAEQVLPRTGVSKPRLRRRSAAQVIEESVAAL